MKNHFLLKTLVLLTVFILSSAAGYNARAQTPQTPADCKTGCTSNDVQILRAYLVDPVTLQRLSGSFSCSGTVSVKLALELTTNTPRVGVVVYANVKNFSNGVVGSTLATKKECFSTALNQPTNRVVFSGAFGWPCGTPIVLTDVFLGWGTGNSDFCQSNTAFRCPGTPSKCYALPAGQYIAIEIPTAQNLSRSRCPDAAGGSTATFNLSSLNGDVSNNATNVTVSWYSNSALTTAIGSPSAYSTGSTIVYAKVVNNSDANVYSTATVTLTVLAGAALLVTNPAAVCGPATVSITGTGVTTGSTLPAGTSLTYWSDSAATTSLTTPTSLAAGTYYIKAATNSSPSCVDIRPVTVTIHAAPTLSVTNPAALCSPATADLTSSAVTTGSTLPTGTSLTYWSNSAATTSLTAPAAAGDGTYYIKAQTNTTPACSDIKSVVVTVRSSPVLQITAPAGVCAPATVSLTAAAVTSGSTLPSGTSLSYWTNSGATTAVTTPSAVTGGTYYIKAATNTTPVCSDIKSVTVTVSPSPDAPALCAIQPSMCGPATGTLTVTSPTGGSYQYSIDSGQHWQTAATFSNVPPASNPSIFVKNGYGCVSATATSCSNAVTCSSTARMASTTAAPPITGIERRSPSGTAAKDDALTVRVYPNPYRNTVSFTFTAPVSGRVSLEVYDNSGRQLAAIGYGEVSAGVTRVLHYSPRQRLSALQLYRLRIGNRTVSGKMIQTE
ncbi:hypothetical protein [Flaviaesturariibacter terrae]